MPQAGFQPTIPVFVRAKTIHALDRADTVIGKTTDLHLLICRCLVRKENLVALSLNMMDVASVVAALFNFSSLKRMSHR
jgi:hypothetical protein